MSSDDHRRRANHLKLMVSLGFVILFAGALFLGQRLFFSTVEQAGKPQFQGKLQRSRTPVSLPAETQEVSSNLNSIAAAVPPRPTNAVPDHAETRPPLGNDATPNPQPPPAPTFSRNAETSLARNESPVPVSSNGRRAGATLTGRVTLVGKPPAERPIDALLKDPYCSKLLTNQPATRFYIQEKNGLGDVFVYVKEGLHRVPPPSNEPVRIDQVNCEYTPYVVGLQTGQTLFVRNSDPVLHNVHPTPNVPGNKEKNLAQMPRSRDLAFAFDQPELFLRFKCDVHPWMFAYVCVVDHPYFAVTKPDGTYVIEGLPPGRYIVEAIHRKAGRATQEVTVSPRSTKAQASFQLAVGTE